MIVTRFCSITEFIMFVCGEVLRNDTDHFMGGKGGSTSKGFCFTEDDPHTAWRYLKGLVSPDVCMVLDIDKDLLTKSSGKYGDYSDGKDGTTPCLKTEYCTCEYSNKTARLIKALSPYEFSTPAELMALQIFMASRQELFIYLEPDNTK